MGSYILRKVALMIPQLIGVYLLLFLVLRVAGTDPAYLYLPKHATPEEIAAFRHEKGLDKPLWYQCLSGMKDLVTLDLGYSWSSKEPVSKMFLDGVGPSVALTLPALLLYTLISIALGLICAYWRGTLIDKTIIVLATVGMAISYVAVMIFAQYFLAFLPSEYGHPIFPVIGYESGFDWVYLLDRIPVMPWPRNLRYIVLPTLISTFVALGYDTRFFRSIAVEEINRDYIRTAKAYGATTRTILFKHVLKNIMIPIIARVVVTLPFLITGSFLLESFFVVPGLGYKLLAAIQGSDYPVIFAFTMLIAVLVNLANMLADILNSLVDPRVKLA